MTFPNSKNTEAICQLLSNLPPQTAVEAVVVNGAIIGVTAFLNLDEENNLAYFMNGTSLAVYDCKDINMVQFPAP